MSHIVLRSHVRFSAGPLKGMVGEVIRSVSVRRFVVLLDFFRCKATVDVNEADLILVDKTLRTTEG